MQSHLSNPHNSSLNGEQIRSQQGDQLNAKIVALCAGEGEEDGSGDDGAGADAEDASLDIGDDDVDDSGADEELDDEFEEGTAAAEERRRSHSDASASDSEGEGEKGADGAAAGDNKAASFARAFAKIMATGGAQKGILSVRTQSPVFQFDGQGNCTGEAFIVLPDSFKPFVLLSFSGSIRSASSAC